MAQKQDRKRYEVLDAMLKERQREIRARRRSLREVLPAEVAQVKDAEEQSMQDFASGMDFALMEMESDTLRKIDEALRRLEDGTYGVCAECDERISEARLRAVPFATLCRDCQAHEEQAVRVQPRVDFEADPAGGRGRRVADRAPFGAASLIADLTRNRHSRAW